MKTLNITISKNFGKNISLELPNGSKHIITQSHNPSLYHELIDHLNEKEQRSNTLLLPDDYDFDEKGLPLENNEI